MLGIQPAGRLWLLIHRERWWMEVFWEAVDRTSHPHPKLRVETWSDWEQIKIRMMFSKKQGINQGRTHTILDKIHDNFLVCKREKSILGNSANDCFWLKVEWARFSRTLQNVFWSSLEEHLMFWSLIFFFLLHTVFCSGYLWVKE